MRDHEAIAARESGRTTARRSIPDLLLVTAFIVLFLVQLAHHEMWRDELNAFGIALASPTLSSLFWHIHYEGHPWLWYFLLWIVTRLTTSLVGMRILQALIGISVYVIIGLGSPFSRREKILLFLCYFISFEYTVVSRMYGVMLLLLLIYIRQRALHPERVLTGALLLGFMASTDIVGILLSGALFVEYSFSALTPENGASTPVRQRVALGAAIYLGLTAVSVWSLIPSPNVSWRTTEHPLEYARDLKHLGEVVVRSVAMPYFPEFQPGSFWNVVTTRHNPLLLLSPFVPLVLGGYYLLFRPRRNLLLLIGLTILASVAFGHLIYTGSLRHYGITFLAFLAALWLLRSQTSRLPWIAWALLGLTAIGGLYAGVEAWLRPFSNSGVTARWLIANDLDRAPLVGAPDVLVVSVAELLNRPIYMLDCNCSDTYLLFSKRRDSFNRSQIPDRLEMAARAIHETSFLYLGMRPFTGDEESALRNKALMAQPLASFTGAQVDEDFLVYRISAGNLPAKVTTEHLRPQRLENEGAYQTLRMAALARRAPL